MNHHVCGSKGRAGEACRDPDACGHVAPRMTREDGWVRAFGADPHDGHASIRDLDPDHVTQIIRVAEEMARDVVRLRGSMEELAGALDEMNARYVQRMRTLEDAQGRIESAWGFDHRRWPIDLREHWGMLESGRQTLEDQWAWVRKREKDVDAIRDRLGEAR